MTRSGSRHGEGLRLWPPPWWSARHRRRGATILVADDDADVRTALRIRLGKAGLRVREAGSGSEALRMARQELPDLILLDVKMPAGNGFSVMERLQEQADTRDIPIVFLTANPHAVNRERALMMGAAGFVPKPYDGRELLQVVQRVLEGNREGLLETVPAGGGGD